MGPETSCVYMMRTTALEVENILSLMKRRRRGQLTDITRMQAFYLN